MAKKKLPETSLEAYKSLDPTQLIEIYRQIIWGLSQIGEGTFEEIAAAIKLPRERVWKRMTDLEKMGLAYRPGNKRLLKSGRNGFTWMLTQEGVPKTTVTEKSLKGKSVSDYSKELTKPAVKQTELFLRH